ncbi:HPr family phosphocarrier protein [Psychromonas sp. Urea-02u-13]|uniref:HPr family phosphocarrier protein n=1 Tax=Psychromonas sp. Urea-02u-13 TaxID=2058326 RepID=UPI000C33356A|nr:HPr family phosphocarrier protein [Psychromonas sp. Urea-02u-13]PKG38556.1 HPr family phosphocarrier protein [Psychromonas sp. Urea-02u-13]
MDIIKQTITIQNKLGLHTRATIKLVELVNDFDAKITIRHHDKQADADSVLGLLVLETCYGQEIEIIATGNEAQQAMSAVTQLIEDKFLEEE